MAEFRKFTEYLDQKGKVQEKPTVDALADTTPKAPANPEPAAHQGKNWTAEAAAVKDKPVPYSAPAKDEGQPKYEKGLGNDGPENLVYKPDTEDQAILKSWPKSNMEQFLDDTKGMNISEFTKYIKEKGNLSEGAYKDMQTIGEAASLISKNEYLLELFIRETKRQESFNKVIKESLKHTEAYQELAYAMASEKVCRNIAKALNELTAPPAAETEVSKKDLEKKGKVQAEGKKRTRTVAAGGPLDMGSSDVVTTGTTVKPEHNLVNALLQYQRIAGSINELFQHS